MDASGSSMRLARSQRRNMSLPEVQLWMLLRRSPEGVRFRRQHAMGPYVADFYCAAAKVVIEVDGAAHAMGRQGIADARKDAWMEARGFRVVRVPASDVLKDPTAVADSLIAICKTRP